MKCQSEGGRAVQNENSQVETEHERATQVARNDQRTLRGGTVEGIDDKNRPLVLGRFLRPSGLLESYVRRSF